MHDEHTRFDDKLFELEGSLQSGDHETARAQLAAFDVALSRYVRNEERVVFPALERLVSTPFAPAIRMRLEHGSLRRLIAALRFALDRSDRRRGLDALGKLRSLLLLHVAKEEWILYPLLARGAR